MVTISVTVDYVGSVSNVKRHANGVTTWTHTMTQEEMEARDAMILAVREAALKQGESAD